MGIYLNPGNESFQEAISSKIYVDKTELIEYTNKVLHTNQKYICVSRPRRFGKSIAANMLSAYYSKGCNSKELFHGLKIETYDDFSKYINKYDTISLNMQEFLCRSGSVNEMIVRVTKLVVRELKKEYPDTDYYDECDLAQCMQDVYEENKNPFIIIIDEWDCVFREYKEDKRSQELYLDFLRNLLKDKGFIYLSYMTGILPIKKYGTHSALNMFDEFSMLDAGPLASFVGFTESEVSDLCKKYDVNLSEMKNWYDGYTFVEVGSVYSPRSVVNSILFGKFAAYWNQTETFEALRMYIDMNFEGLRDDVLSMMAGERIPVNTGSFSNDMTTFHSEDDVLTLLIHLGYLAYDAINKCAYIPNFEIEEEFANAVSVSEWGEISKALKMSADTLNAIWQGREAEVAKGLEYAHFETSHLQYNDENALSYTISLALYAAKNYYNVFREMPSGKGFADLVYIPRKNVCEKPALLVELKWNLSASGAIDQIKNKQYVKALEDYLGTVLLVGINYDKKTKEHTCKIEKWEKE